MAISAEDMIIHHLKDKVGLAEADKLVARLKAETLEAAAESSAQTVDLTNADTGHITIGDSSRARTVEVTPSPWTAEESEHYQRTGETPLARLHRQNLDAQWSETDRATEK
ncbi:hypothetical protein [Streptomyces alboviridis]|uniref:hypothetical protein n=1 Tax=Streptomyces alboviridis TaxID=67269 RepID=UPI000516A9B5|nr:hypothetical protein [Streptomyces alboviridis]